MLIWRWLNNSPLTDPIERKLSPILQLVLIAILVVAPINFLIDTVEGGVAPDMIGAAIFLSLCAGVLLVLRQGYFKIAAGILILVLLLGNNTRLTNAPIADADEALITFFLPITIAGILSRRPLLLGIFAVSCLLILSTANAEKLGSTTISVFIINAGLVSFLIDLMGRTLHAELKAAGIRNEELEKARHALEVSSAELFKANERLTVTLKSIGDAVMVTDTSGKVTLLNTVAEQLTGWSQTDAEGQAISGIFRIVNEQTRETVESPVDKVLREGKIVGLANHTVLLARDGREIPIDDSGAPIIDNQGGIAGVVLVFRDISERKQAEDALHEHIKEITVLEERQRLSRDLHDAVSQMLFASSLIAEALTRGAGSPEKLQYNLERLQRLNRGALAEMRKLLLELRSPELMNTRLPELLQQLAEAAMGSKEMEITINVTENDILSPEMQIAFYRITQEALNNILKHARATQAAITFHSSLQQAILNVKDNGRGFDTGSTSKGIGLHTMRERADALGATFEVKSQVGQGTEIIIHWKPPV